MPIQDTLDTEERRRGLTLASWNVGGLNNPIKRGKALAHLKSLSQDIIFLRETHMKNYSHTRLKCKWIWNICHSSFPAKARDTAIMIRKGIPFIHKATISDKEGRFLMSFCDWGNIFYTSHLIEHICTQCRQSIIL